MRIHVVGAGFVGTVTAVVLAEMGHHATLLEKNPQRRALLQAGDTGFTEPGLAVALKHQQRRGSLDVPDPGDAGPAQLTVICVGTPRLPDGAADLQQVLEAATEAAGRMEDGVVAIKSTVPPGTLRQRIAPAVADLNPGLATASLPEFLAEGDALVGARQPARVVIGSDDDDATRLLADLHAGLQAPVITTDPTTAEMIKYGSNAMLAARIGLVNEMANLCEGVGVSVDVVMAGVGLDPRIGSGFLRAGLGFGGSCFPKDVAALCHLARRQDLPLRILETVLEANEAQPLRALHLLEQEIGDLRGKQIALLGLSFKPGTSDLRESRAVAVYRALRVRGASVVAHDPAASKAFLAMVPEAVLVADPADAVAGADACIIATAWPTYRSLDWSRLAGRMRQPVLIDGWRTLEPTRLEGMRYRAIGHRPDAAFVQEAIA